MMNHVFEKAESYLGTSEIVGVEHNPIVVDWLREILPWVNDDETAWCAAFVNAMLNEAGLVGTKKANARSYLNWGRPTYTPVRGDVVVFWRSSIDSWKGHVAFFDAFDTRNGQMGLWVLGGNQGNKVSKKWYPLGRVLAFRTL